LAGRKPLTQVASDPI